MHAARSSWVAIVVVTLAGASCAVDSDVESSHGRAVVEASAGSDGLAWVGYDGGDGVVLVVEQDGWGSETGRWLRVSPGEYGGEFVIDAATAPDNWFWWEMDEEGNVLVASDAPPDPDAVTAMLDELGTTFAEPGGDPASEYCETCAGGSWIGDKLFGTRMARAITNCSFFGALLVACVTTLVIAPPAGATECAATSTATVIAGVGCGFALGLL